MSLRSARVVARSLRSASAPARTAALSLRTFSSTPISLKKEQTSDPTPITNAPQFPTPVDPFQPAKPAPPTSAQYSEGTKSLVRGVARLMGYNSRKSTAIRETGAMMHGIVGSIEAERAFWYETCALPPTYQSFFQLHLLYVLLLVTRLRALRSGSSVAESTEAGAASAAAGAGEQPSGVGLPSTAGLTVMKPVHEAYPTELLSHFFELAESQMRMVLGRTERERVIRKYMDEMGEQWKGAGTGLDYVLGLGLSSVPAEVERADAELASWIWRNLFASRGLAPGPYPQPVDELQFIPQLNLVVRFVRRELARLDAISDEDVIAGNIGKWGRVEQ